MGLNVLSYFFKKIQIVIGCKEYFLTVVSTVVNVVEVMFNKVHTTKIKIFLKIKVAC